jgi:hypothetical protein
MELKLTDDQINKIIIDDLVDMFKMYLQEENGDMVDHITHILGIYMTESKFNEFKEKYEIYHEDEDYSSDNKIVIDEIIDNTDGSCMMKFTVPDDLKNILISEGFKYLLIKAAIGNPSDEEIIEKFTKE